MEQNMPVLAWQKTQQQKSLCYSGLFFPCLLFGSCQEEEEEDVVVAAAVVVNGLVFGCVRRAVRKVGTRRVDIRYDGD